MLPSPATTVWSSRAALRLVFLPAQAVASRPASKALPSGSGPTSRISGCVRQFRPRHQQHEAEPARIVERHGGARRHVEHDVVMGRSRRSRVMERAGRPVLVAVADAERAGHAEMHQQHVAGGEVRGEVLGAAADPGHGRAFDPSREVLRQRAAQVRPARLHLDDAGAFHHRLQSAPHGFDLGKFGHAGLPVHLRWGFATGDLRRRNCDGGIDSASAPPGLWSPRTEDCHAGYRRNPFRLPDHRSRPQAGDGGRCLSPGRAPLRPDERPHVRRAASRLEGCDGDHAEPAAEGPLRGRRRRRRHRGCRLPGRRGRRPRDRRHRLRHQPRHARGRARAGAASAGSKAS